MTVDAGTLSALLIGAASLVGWMFTQAQARSRAQRMELRGRRQRDLLRGRYLNRLEQVLSDRDIPLPAKPEGLDKLDQQEGEEW